MKWVKFDSYGNEQIWYSDDEVDKLNAIIAVQREEIDKLRSEIKRVRTNETFKN